MSEIIYLNASEVSIFINKNKYKDSRHLFLNILRNQYGHLYDECVNQNVKKEVVRNINTMETINFSVDIHKKDVLELSRLKLENNISEYTSKYEDIKNKILEDVIEIDKIDNEGEKVYKNEKGMDKLHKDMVDILEERITMSAGTLSENIILNNIESNMNTQINDRNNAIKYIYIDLNDGYKLKIGGRVDGVTNGVLVEVKKRKNKLFNYIPDYEMIQVQVYLEMFNINNCIFVEEYSNNTVRYDIGRNSNEWISIKSDLIKYGNMFIDILKDKEKMASFIHSCI